VESASVCLTLAQIERYLFKANSFALDRAMNLALSVRPLAVVVRTKAASTLAMKAATSSCEDVPSASNTRDAWAFEPLMPTAVR
jgi:hypothetical protein